MGGKRHIVNCQLGWHKALEKFPMANDIFCFPCLEALSMKIHFWKLYIWASTWSSAPFTSIDMEAEVPVAMIHCSSYFSVPIILLPAVFISFLITRWVFAFKNGASQLLSNSNHWTAFMAMQNWSIFHKLFSWDWSVKNVFNIHLSEVSDYSG